METIYLNIKTGYTFKQVYGHLDKIAEKCAKYADFGGIADIGNTFSHIPWQKACKTAGIKPIYGVQLPVTEDLQRGIRRYPFNMMTLVAKNVAGLREIYRLVDISFQQFYYRQRITYDQINDLSDSVVVLSGIAPRWDLIKKNIWQELNPSTAYLESHCAKVAACDNFYVDQEDVWVYEPFADQRLRERKTTPIHIPTYIEWQSCCNDETAIERMKKIASECNVELPHAPMVKYIGNDDILEWCKKGAKDKGINITEGQYAERYKREIDLIEEKDYTDYFLVVADAIRYAKTKLCVGHARGCFLPGQRVNTLNKNSRKIETLTPGDKVKSAFGSTKEVLETFKYEIDEEICVIEFEDGTVLKCTNDHLILTIDGWKPAEKLTESDNICDVRTSIKKLFKLEQHGWDIVAAHRWLHFGFIDWEYYIEHLYQYPKNSKKEIKFICSECCKESYSQVRQITNRSNGLANMPICNRCINMMARNTPEAKLVNSRAQLIAQNKPEQKLKNKKAQIKRHNKDWNQAKYDKLFSNDKYKKWLVNEHYENKCQLCGADGNDNRMELHHIDGNKNSKPKNLILLCISCHTTYHNYSRYNNSRSEDQKAYFIDAARSLYENKKNKQATL